ncbi:methionine ABC transporter permease [Cellulomonas bogoriensis]|uniref:Methionine ABC transporter ATP-binding protein n=1 Tax=Cellulomonas bogoriensis 69B4 = DSM 16987 TaxID=1386082 RepID=A0A0A0C243_9CELL|nr:methionine ABC transporter permease [Cellulomonas bogoriensis]KGM14226.1 methionine ABC transporter ATP-binding protein [Cellulomonas bogoriensis 69B4 = DSM 16987]
MNRETNWDYLLPQLWEAFGDTVYMVSVTLLISGVVGLAMGLAIYVTRRGNFLQNRTVFAVLNVVINTIRPIPFVIFVFAVGPVVLWLVGRTIGTEAAIPPMAVMASVAFARLVEQNLVALDPGVIEAARAMGASRWRVIWSVLIPEALGPLILAFTFLTIAVIDMSAIVGMIGAGGLGDFAIRHGYQRFNWDVVLVTVAVIVVMVQAVQLLGNALARRFLRR